LSLTETTGKPRGSLVFADQNDLRRRGVKAAVNIALGDPVSFDVNGFAEIATNVLGNMADGFGTALEVGDNTTGADGDVKIQIAVGNSFVMQQAGAAIKPFSLLKVDSSSKLIQHTNPDASVGAAFPAINTEIDTVRDFFGLTFGRYYGLEKQEDDALAAVLDDIIVVRHGV